MPPAWFQRAPELLDRVDAYMAAFGRRADDVVLRREVEAAANLSIVRLIFESNTMEGAGPATEDSTREVLIRGLGATPEAHLPERTPQGAWADARPSRHDLVEVDLHTVELALRSAQGDGATPLVVQHGGASRSDVEVLAHLEAVRRTRDVVVAYNHERWRQIRHDLLQRKVAAGALTRRDALAAWAAMWPEHPFAPVHPLLVVEQDVLDLHATLARGLLPDGPDGPGHYRTRPIFFGRDHQGVAPDNLRLAMATFVRRANAPDADFGGSVRKAAWVAHRFVEIHPFLDGNGRMSRLLLNLVLWAAGIPFAVALRGGPAHKKRYLSALHRADRGQIDPFAALIAEEIVRTFATVERRLVEILGAAPLVPPEP